MGTFVGIGGIIVKVVVVIKVAACRLVVLCRCRI